MRSSVTTRPVCVDMGSCQLLTPIPQTAPVRSNIARAFFRTVAPGLCDKQSEQCDFALGLREVGRGCVQKAFTSETFQHRAACAAQLVAVNKDPCVILARISLNILNDVKNVRSLRSRAAVLRSPRAALNNCVPWSVCRSRRTR